MSTVSRMWGAAAGEHDGHGHAQCGGPIVAADRRRRTYGYRIELIESRA